MQVYRFTFNNKVRRQEIEEKISFAIISAECTFGKAKVRLNAAYLASDRKVVIDVTSPVGEHIAEIFTGLLIKDYGETAFKVEKIRDESHSGIKGAI